MSYVLKGVGAGFEQEGGAKSALRKESQTISDSFQALATKLFGGPPASVPSAGSGGGGLLRNPVVLAGGALAVFLYMRSRKKRGR